VNPGQRRERVRLVVVAGLLKLALFTLYVTLWWHTRPVAHMVVDLRGWMEFLRRCAHGAIPYVDIAKEYPVGTGVFFWFLAPLLPLDSLQATTAVHGVLMIALDLVCLAIFYSIACEIDAERARVAALFFTLNLTSLLLTPLRFESLVVLFVLLGYHTWRHGHTVAASGWWSAGVWVKWFPVLLIASACYHKLLAGKLGEVVRCILVFGAVAICANAPFVLLDYALKGDLVAWKFPYWFHTNRPLYWDTVLGVCELWVGSLSIEQRASALSMGLVAIALVAWPRLRFEYRAVLATLAGLALNRVYSAQFHLWFYPLLLFGMLHEDDQRWRRLWRALVVLDLTNVFVYPFAFVSAADSIQLVPGGALRSTSIGPIVLTAAVLARTVAVVALAVVLVEKPVPEAI
jgi:hypothetical protein